MGFLSNIFGGSENEEDIKWAVYLGLSGSLGMADGESTKDEIDHFYRGDVEIADDNLTHKPKAETGELCICLAATQAPLVFNSWLPKLLQPFIRI